MACGCSFMQTGFPAVHSSFISSDPSVSTSFFLCPRTQCSSPAATLAVDGWLCPQGLKVPVDIGCRTGAGFWGVVPDPGGLTAVKAPRLWRRRICIVL